MDSRASGPSNNSAATTTGQLMLYLETCSKAWVVAYLAFCLAIAPFFLVLHVMAVGLLLCLVTYFRLPPPEPANAFQILGQDPRNIDGTPSKTRSALGLIAHRGACLDAPENSLEAVRLAHKNGAKSVEFDVQATADGHLVVFHDDDVDRVTNGTGPINRMTLKEVQELDLSVKHPLGAQFGPCRIPTLEDFVDECLRLNLKMIIDLKSLTAGHDGIVDPIVGLFRTKPDLHRCAMVTSFQPTLLYLTRLKDPRIVCCMSWRPHYFSHCSWNPGAPREANKLRYYASPLKNAVASLSDILVTWALDHFLWHFIGLSAVALHKDVLTSEYIQFWRERGVRVLAWTVNNSLQRLYLERYHSVTCFSDTMDEIALDKLVQD